MSPEELHARIIIEGECWVYTGPINGGGYGVAWHEGKSWKAHRLAFTFWRGIIPNDLDVLHTCDNPPCVNPDHLFTGTASDNMNDMFAKGRADRSGSNNGRAKLTEQQVKEILFLIKENKHTLVAISNMYYIAPSTIRYIRCQGWMKVKEELKNVIANI